MSTIDYGNPDNTPPMEQAILLINCPDMNQKREGAYKGLLQ